MSHIRTIVWVAGISWTILVNLEGAIGPFSKGLQRPVGDDVVAVYPCKGEPTEVPIPVTEWDPSKGDDGYGRFVETGPKVQVFVRNSYRRDAIVACPRETLLILGATILLYIAIGAIGLVIRPRKPLSGG